MIARFAGWTALWTVFALVTSGLATAALTAGFVALSGPDERPLTEAISAFVQSGSPWMLVLGIVPTSLTFFVVAWTQSARDELRLRAAAPLDFVLAAMGMIAISTAAGALVSLLGLVDDGTLRELNEMFVDMPWSTRLLVLPATALGPGIAEELFFRGLVLGRGEARVGRVAAVVVSALAFGAVHMDPGHALAAAIMGGYLAFVVLRTQSLYVTIVAHIANNALATLAPELNGSSATSLGTSLWALGAGSLVGVWMLVLIARRHP